jgi:hypothetical protein
MKLQCPCGAKYAFDLTPEMLASPVSFVCPACGADHSVFVNELVRQEFGTAAPAPENIPAPPSAPPTAPAGSRLKISHEAKAPEAPVETAPVSKYCQKHRGVLATEKCAECGKPICPQCMELFGYFCSPLCQNKADLKGKAVPVYAGLKSEVESRFWRKTGLIFGALGIMAVSALGFWGWYLFYGSRPHVIFSQHFEQKSSNGGSQITGKNQFIFLHGGTLARVDLGSKKTVWSRDVISKKEYDDAVAAELQADSGSTYHTAQTKLEKFARRHLEEELLLSVDGENIWVARGAKATRYDWNSGNSGESKHVTPKNISGDDETTGLPLDPNDASGKPLDPDKVAAQAQNLKLQGKLALPALIANSLHQRQIFNEINDNPANAKNPSAKKKPPESSVSATVHTDSGDLLVTVQLLEERIVTRSAMKAPPKKSALDGEVNQAATMDIANETLNELQRNNGGDQVSEDQSRYQVSIRKPGEPDTAGWTGEVVGPPMLHALKTVNVLTAGKGVIVLDHDNKKLWTATLTYNVLGEADESQSPAQFGEGPCVERGNTLYIFDQAVLSAFELNTGNARWRLPSVGIVGLFFDGQDNVIVNTTSGSPDDIKYSRQIDVTKTTDLIVQKIAAQTGKILWTAKPAGHVSYVSGNIIYATQLYDSGFDPDEDGNDMINGLQKKDYFRVVRLDPKSGRDLWTYEEQRAPSSVRFHDTAIELVFKTEVQVLRYMTF